MELIQERNLGLDDAEAVRELRRKQRELEAVLDDELANEPVKAEARREREEILEFLGKNSWRTRDNAGRCVRAIAVAVKRFHARLAKAVDAEGRPHPVLQGFARHLREHLLIPSGRGGGHGRARASWSGAGCFTYEPPPGVVWGGAESSRRPTSNIEHPTSNIQHRTSNIQQATSDMEHRAIANSRWQTGDGRPGRENALGGVQHRVVFQPAHSASESYHEIYGGL